MGSTHNLIVKAGVTFNGKDILDIHPDVVRAVIKKDKTGIVKAIIESKMMKMKIPFLFKQIMPHMPAVHH